MESNYQASSLKLYAVGTTCCAGDLRTLDGCRYDIERLGCRFSDDIQDADVLVVFGGMSQELEEQFQLLRASIKKHYLIVVGACACSSRLGADVFVPGCPPRPESIIRSLIEIQRRHFETPRS
jgi:NADH-quinone oxidoreductase subunit B